MTGWPATGSLTRSAGHAFVVPRTAGLIRPPGARHKSGGYQQLDGTLDGAYRVLRERNPPAVWQALSGELAADISVVRADRVAADRAAATGVDAMFINRAGAPRELAADYLRIATTGLYDTTRYPTVRGPPGRHRRRRLDGAAPDRCDRTPRTGGVARPGVVLQPLPAPRSTPGRAPTGLAQRRHLDQTTTRK